MCFSAQASFTAAAILATTGALSLRQVETKEEIPLASIPFIFAIQQLVEGFLWLADKPSPEANLLTYSFLFFAYILWPVWVPLSYYFVEKVKKYKRDFLYLIALGVLVSLALLIMMIIFPPVAVELDHHIKYKLLSNGATDYFFVNIIVIGLYLAAVSGVGLFSCHKYLRIFSAFIALSMAISFWFYYNSWQSTWCFFSALLSVIIYLHFRFKNGLKLDKKAK